MDLVLSVRKLEPDVAQHIPYHYLYAASRLRL